MSRKAWTQMVVPRAVRTPARMSFQWPVGAWNSAKVFLKLYRYTATANQRPP